MADSLKLLRHAIAAGASPVLLESADPESSPVDDIAKASHLAFPADKAVAPLSLAVATRFVRKPGPNSAGGPVDLRAAYFCWVCREENVASYISLCGEKDVVNLTFIERTSLVTWLEGADEQSEYITPETSLSSSAADAAVAAEQVSAAAKFKSREIDPVLQNTYNKERVLLNRNSVLRGIKHTDFSYIRKDASEYFIERLRSRGSSANGRPSSRTAPAVSSSPSSSSSQSKRRDPIILLSPSASSLLTMANVKEFLEKGSFVPAPAGSSTANLKMVSRSSNRLGNFRFVVVDSSERFKPDYWDRVVAVFTTGQTWQFRTYKWSDPKELFQKVKGFYVAFAGDPIPENVRQWNVDVVTVDKIHRFRDRETVEGLWDRLDKYMELRGFTGRRQQ
ncbi:RNA pol II accessory factor, Cdc73 family-domain-containing protein [Lipomyces japonicus]|uniref:RNA pol II accessory factor, Cdc73 family-domain-containing protein n=1 Tax=Lipomyces japonicus TaxID=56871 RepID=UPI0034CF7DFC